MGLVHRNRHFVKVYEVSLKSIFRRYLISAKNANPCQVKCNETARRPAIAQAGVAALPEANARVPYIGQIVRLIDEPTLLLVHNLYTLVTRLLMKRTYPNAVPNRQRPNPMQPVMPSAGPGDWSLCCFSLNLKPERYKFQMTDALSTEQTKKNVHSPKINNKSPYYAIEI